MPQCTKEARDHAPWVMLGTLSPRMCPSRTWSGQMPSGLPPLSHRRLWRVGSPSDGFRKRDGRGGGGVESQVRAGLAVFNRICCFDPQAQRRILVLLPGTTRLPTTPVPTSRDTHPSPFSRGTGLLAAGHSAHAGYKSKETSQRHSSDSPFWARKCVPKCRPAVFGRGAPDRQGHDMSGSWSLPPRPAPFQMPCWVGIDGCPGVISSCGTSFP